MYENKYINWFKYPQKQNGPLQLGGWSKELPAEQRRKLALESRPIIWNSYHRYLNTGQTLQKMAKITQDQEIKQKATQDAKFFFEKICQKRI